MLYNNKGVALVYAVLAVPGRMEDAWLSWRLASLDGVGPLLIRAGCVPGLYSVIRLSGALAVPVLLELRVASRLPVSVHD